MDQRLIVVARNRLDLCDYQRQQFFEDKDIQVLVDRRWAERRQGVQAHEPERRRADRRQEPVREGDLNRHGFAVIRRKPEAVGLEEIEKPTGEVQNQIEVKPPVDATAVVQDKSSLQTPSIQGTPPAERGSPPNGNGILKGRLPGAAKGLVSEETSIIHSTAYFEQNREEWLEMLKKVGMDNLRLPENSPLCAPWRKFLNELRAADGPASLDKGAGQHAGIEMERMTAVENRQRDTKWSEERVKIQAVKSGTRADTVRYLFIVSRDQAELCDRLTRDFSADKEVQVLLDRRQGQRRPQHAQARGRERRRANRRRQPEGWTVPVSQLYRGDRPCVMPPAEDPIRQPTGRREDGASFFRRSNVPAGPEDALTRAPKSAGANGGEMTGASVPFGSPAESAAKWGSWR